MNNQNNQYESEFIARLNKMRNRQIVFKILICLACLGVCVDIALAIWVSTSKINKLGGEIACIVICVICVICIIVSAGYKFTWLPLIKVCQVKRYNKVQQPSIQSLIENMDGIVFQDGSSTVGYKKTNSSTMVFGILNVDDKSSVAGYKNLFDKMHSCLNKKYDIAFVTIFNCAKENKEAVKFIYRGKFISKFPCSAQLSCACFQNDNQRLFGIPEHSESKSETYSELEKIVTEYC